jgi:hypothetical protein
LDVILEFFRMVDNAEDSSPVGALIGHLLRPEREPMNKSLEERFDERVEDFRSGGGDSALRLLSQTRLTESESRDPQIVTFHRRLSHRLGA